MPRNESSIPKEWVAHADTDLKAARLLFASNEGFPHLIASHCHRAIEKYLKAALLSFKLEKPKIHDLIVLVNSCAQHDEAFKELMASAQLLDPTYLENRYPFEHSHEYSDEELAAFIRAAEHVRDFVSSRIA